MLSSIPTDQEKIFLFLRTTWSADDDAEIIDGVFYRWFTMASASRNSYFNIVSSRGMVDPQTLLATVSVSYPIYGATSSVSYSDYFSIINMKKILKIKAFSLPEIIVYVAIFSIIILAISRTVSSSANR